MWQTKYASAVPKNLNISSTFPLKKYKLSKTNLTQLILTNSNLKPPISLQKQFIHYISGIISTYYSNFMLDLILLAICVTCLHSFVVLTFCHQNQILPFQCFDIMNYRFLTTETNSRALYIFRCIFRSLLGSWQCFLPQPHQ